jgi:hypothetical protein
MAFEHPNWISFFINMHNFGILAGSIKAIVFNIGMNFKYKAIMVVKLPLDLIFTSLLVNFKQFGTLIYGTGDEIVVVG